MAKRRSKGDGGLYQRCEAFYGCPPVEIVQTDDGPKKVRPEHRCRGLWVGVVDLGWFDGKRQRRVVTAKDHKVAKAKLDKLMTRVQAGGLLPGKSITVEKWLRYWLDEIAFKRNKPSTIAGYTSKIETLLVPQLGKHKLDQLEPQHLRAAYKRMEKGRSSTTVLQAHSILRKSLNDAMREGRVQYNVALLLDAPQKAASNRGALSTTEARTVLRYAARPAKDGQPVDRIGSRWAAALLAGLRLGERLGLTLDAVDLDYINPNTGEHLPRLEVSWQLQRIPFRHGCADDHELPPEVWPCGRQRPGSCPDRKLKVRKDFEVRQLDGGLCLIRPKSKAGWRIVPVVPPLEAALRQRMALAETEPNPHGLMWTRPDGRPIDPNQDNATWDTLLREVGATDVTGHEARHTTATLLHEAGVDGHTVQQIMGQSTITTTRGYQHVDDHMMRAGMMKMVELLELEG